MRRSGDSCCLSSPSSNPQSPETRRVLDNYEWRLQMKRKFAWMFLFALSACAGSAAQEPAGKFTVSHDSHWGTALLPAGTYVVSVHSGPVPFVTVTSQDRNAVSIMAVAEYMDSPECTTSSLQLEQGSG